MAAQDLEHRGFRMKRPHSKSKLGCRTCKRRRVKCDERRPECNQCRLRGLECGFDPIPSPYKGKTTEDVSKDCSFGPSEDIDTHEQVLTRRYLTHVVRDFSHNNALGGQIDFWRVTVPAVAYSWPIVRHGMLALASLSLHFDPTTSVADKDTFWHKAIIHGDSAVKLCRQGLESVGERDVDALLAGSRMLAVLGFAFASDHRRNGFSMEQPEAWNWIRTVRGVAAVQMSLRSSGYSLDEAIEREEQSVRDSLNAGSPRSYGCSEPGSPDSGVCVGSQALQILIRESQTARFEALRAAVSVHDPTGAGEAVSLLQAIGALEEVTEYVSGDSVQGIFRVLCTWACNVGPEFVEMMVQGHALARAIYAHWLMLAILVEDCWWVSDMGRAGIREIASSSVGAEISDLLQWPLAMVAA